MHVDHRGPARLYCTFEGRLEQIDLIDVLAVATHALSDAIVAHRADVDAAIRPVAWAEALCDEGGLLHAPGVVDRDDHHDRHPLARGGFQLHDVEAHGAVTGDDASEHVARAAGRVTDHDAGPAAHARVAFGDVHCRLLVVGVDVPDTVLRGVHEDRNVGAVGDARHQLHPFRLQAPHEQLAD